MTREPARTLLAQRGAAELAAGIARGAYTSSEVVEALLERIEEVEPKVRAWAHLDPGLARKEAQDADRQRQSGGPIGPLHGVPVALKDIIDTRDRPTENGTVLDAGRRPRQDAALVPLLRRSGAIVLGKTVTTELAYYAPSKTRNPHHEEHTPGGSSSGSAAAVAAGMVPIAVGTQTNGSVIRPASFCGVVGYKPTFGLIPRSGVLAQSFELDTVGVFGRSVLDAALLAEALIGHDACRSGDRADRAPLRLPEAAQAQPPLPPTFAFVGSPVWDLAEEDTRRGFGDLAQRLGGRCDPVDLPAPFARGHAVHRVLMATGFARNLGRYYERGKDRLSGQMQSAIEEGRTVLAHDYLAAVDCDRDAERRSGGDLRAL